MAAGAAHGDEAAVAACERWLVRRGVPHLIADYDAGEDIWTWAIPLLVVLYVARGLYALDLDQSLLSNLLALALVIGVLVATWVGTNRLRHRPVWSWPREVGPWELVVFVVGPEIPPALLGQWADALRAALAGLVALGVVYLGTSYALVPMARWAGGRSLALAASLGSVLSRALPLMLVVVTFLFFTGEVWQTVGTLDGLSYALVLGLFVAIGVGFVLTRLPGDLRGAGTLESWEEVRELVVDTPAAGLPIPTTGAPPAPELTRRQYVNVTLVGLFARTIQIVVVSLAVGAFLGVLGVLAIDAEATALLSAQDPDVLVTLTLGQRDVVVTAEALRVAGFLATFAGLSFTVQLVTDPTYRDEFRTDMGSELREVFAVRAAYLEARARLGLSSRSGPAAPS